MVEPGQPEELKDDDGACNTLEHFAELEEVLAMIENLKTSYEVGFEKDYEEFWKILSRYQEQPHLLDAHMEKVIDSLLAIIRDPKSPQQLVHAGFKYFFIISKVRTYKALVKFLPHEIHEMDFVVNLLEKQNPQDLENWETRYMLILWLSILVLNPFHMARLDAHVQSVNVELNHTDKKMKMERIVDICKIYCENNDTCANVAAFLAAKYFIRAEIKEIYLKSFLDWIMHENTVDSVDTKFGQLAAVSAILKHGKREDLLPHAERLLQWILACNYKESSEFLKYKYSIKIIQRLGMIFLKPRIAIWRYKRGARSLTANLGEGAQDACSGKNELLADEDVEDISVPDAIEEIIEELLQGLRSSSSDIRWSSAKGVGRVTNRLPKELGDEVVGSVIELFSPLEQNEAWHGACLAVAELAKRGLLLPYRLVDIVPHLMQALVYDELKGYMSVGQHIRDSACYMSWAFARAYDPKDLEPFIVQMSGGLLITAVFDREINCRRAASAAFQEIVGRIGNFPNGIDILTKTDFYSVGLRTNSYLKCSDYIAQYEDYTKPLIDHLVDKKTCHWDTAIRELAANALRKLTVRAPQYVACDILPKLFETTNSIDLNARHGSILAIGEISSVLYLLPLRDGNPLYLTNQHLDDLNGLVTKFEQKCQFRGMSGDVMKHCCTDLIRNCSEARILVHANTIESWQDLIDKTIVNKNADVRESGIKALSKLCIAYYDSDERQEENLSILNGYLKGSDNDLEEHIRIGYLSALGVLPKFMLKLKLKDVINSLIKHSLPPLGGLQFLIAGDKKTAKAESENSITFNWSEARRDSIKALATLVTTVGFDSSTEDSIANPEYSNKIFECYLSALDEYTLDNRGDIGAWVREAAMNALYQWLITCPNLSCDYVHDAMSKLAQQAVEKIDRTRGLAAKLFCNIVNHKPDVAHIKRHDKLKEIVPDDTSKVLWLFADQTFPIFCAMLELEEYSERILLGLSASIGQLTESLIKYSSSSLYEYLRSHSNDVPRICNEIVQVFEKNQLNERVTYPMLNFLDNFLSSGTIANILSDESSNFADEIFRLVNNVIKGRKKLYKLISSINVYCQLLQVPRLGAKILSKMSVFLGLTHVHVRKTTATKLYEAIALHGENLGFPEENLDEILTILSESDWGIPLTEVRPIRNKLCTLMGIKPPVSTTQST